MQLRPYQIEAKDAVKEQWKTVDKTLLVLATGTGKTIIFCKLIEDEIRDGSRCLILAHRGELLDQAADKMFKATGLKCAVEKADSSCLKEWYRVVVGSVQTLMSEKRLAMFPRDYFDVIVIDEAHHALADSYQRILDHFDRAKVLGVTATPDRGDMKELGQYFESLAYEYSLPRAIKEGYLCKLKALTIPLNIDLSAVKSQGGDYQLKALGNALDPYLHLIADEMITHCKGRKTIVFLPLIATSQKMQRLLVDRGFRCGEVNGESDNRKEILNDFHTGKYEILCNSMLLSEGYDEPGIDCIVPLRPTKIRSLYCQQVGRGTRPFPGKEFLLILDFLWNSQKHNLCRPASVVAENEEVADAMTKIMADDAGTEMDLEAVELQGEGDCINEREEALAKKLGEMKSRKRKLVDPLQYEMSIQAEDLAAYVPAFGWEQSPASAEQLKALEHAGIMPESIGSAGKAKLVLERLSIRGDEGLSTPRQIKQLELRGFQHVGGWDKEAARKMIVRIASNRWRTPENVNPSTYNPRKTK